jgi:type IV secretory pathway TrbL component
MIISRSNTMKYTPLLLLSVLSVLLIPLLQTAHAQNPLDQLIGGIKNLTSGASKAVNSTASQAGKSASNASQSMNNTASQAGKSANKSASNASQSMNNTASQAGKSAKATNASTIQSNAASYPGNASDTGNNNLTKNTPNPVLGGLANTTKTVSNALGKGISGILNLGNNTAK